MTEEPNTLIMRFPKRYIVQETEDNVMIKIDDAMLFLRQTMTAMTNPYMAIAAKKTEADNCENLDLRN